MNWPNKLDVTYPSGTTTRDDIWAFRYKIGDMKKWCEDNLSSKGVLWELECLPGSDEKDRWSFYFAQPQDAVLFRLVNGV